MQKQYLASEPRQTKLALEIRKVFGLTLASSLLIQGAMAADDVAAAPVAAPIKAEKIEITGSSIKRIASETALPVQTIKREEIERSGVTTAGELLSKVSASAAALTDGASFSDIPGQRGFSGANLRGIGVSSTLVLLNGRRLSNFASPGGNAGVDLNAIPAAAIQRVEVLKDGASAIYGTDAIGGVINFITRGDYQGADASAYTASTQHGGAGKRIFTVSAGRGDLAQDKFNVFGVLDVQKTDSLRSTQRDWIGSAYQADINLDVGSSNTFPANVRITKPSGSPTGSRLNPSAPNCNPPATVYAPDSFVGSKACLYNYMQDTEIFPKSDRLSALLRGQVAISDDLTLYSELLHNKTTTNYRISPLTITNLNYPTLANGGIYYPTSLGVSGPLRVSMRLSAAGNRTNEVDATADRFVFGGKGQLAGWDVDSAINYSVNKVVDNYIDGYVKTSLFDKAFLTGKINPFGASGADGQQLLAAAKVSDAARDSRGSTASFDLKGSKELFDLAGGAAALALGLEFRRETLEFKPSELLKAGEIRGDGTATAFDGDRNVSALYAELNLPITKQLEAQVALRHDRYNDAGNSTNPKFGLRWSPTREVIVRGSYGTGFRAPSLSDLHAPTRLGQTNGIYDDPLGCGKGGISKTDPDYCGLQPDKLTGGRDGLRPEKSKQFSAGIVVAPTRAFNASLDYWRIEKTDVIESPEGTYFADPVRNAAYITRGPVIVTGVPGPITQIDSRLRNLGGLNTSGLDLSLDWRSAATEFGKFGVSLNGTYVIDYKTKEADDASEVSGVGLFINDQVVQRWRHTLTFNWDQGAWGATLQQTFYQGYRDQNTLQDGSERRVEAYQLWDLASTYAPNKSLKFRVGVKNLFDKAPPRSNQVYSFLAGYDPSYTDPRGRTYYGSVSYAFK